MSDYEYLKSELTKGIINDYYTPNIKAEVILDMLLTPYIVKMVERQCKNIGKDLKFVTKEMSIEELEKIKQYGNRGAKIDYILADENTVYLVELKTNTSSISRSQVLRYLKNCYKKKFGDVLGNKLITIMALDKKDIKDKYEEGDLKKLFQRWFIEAKAEAPEQRYAEHAQKLLKEKRWYSTKKYLYTMGQILDYLYDGKKANDIWDKDLRLIYITPDGGDVLPQNNKPCEEKQEQWKSFTECISLKESLNIIKSEGNAYAKFLSSIIEELYS